MIVLETPNMFQLRLGWLLPLVELAAREPLERAQLAEALLETATRRVEGGEQQEVWLRTAGIDAGSQGRNSKRAADEIVRMGVAYGVYDPVARRPTDLGHVLLNVGRETTPFMWPLPKKLIGLRVLLGTDGDVTLALLRAWPDVGPFQANDAFDAVQRVLRDLAQHASDTARSRLERQASRDLYRDVVPPRLEPLRELGLVALATESKNYVRTEAGRRIVDAVGTLDAGSLLRSGLLNAVLATEGLTVTGAAPQEELLVTLRQLPPELRGATREAPLEAVALLTQARLLWEGRYEQIDLSDARQLAEALSGTSSGRIALKAGSLVDHENITWSDDGVLSDPVVETPTPPSTSPPSETPPMPPEAPPVPSETLQPSRHPPSLLWLTYLLRLLDRPGLGSIDALAFGGPWSWSEELLRSLGRPSKIVQAARKPEQSEKNELLWTGAPLSSQPFRRWCHELAEQQAWLLPFWGALDKWENAPRGAGNKDEAAEPVVRDLAGLRVALEEARDAADGVAPKLKEEVDRFLANKTVHAQRWERVRALTRAHIEDLIARGVRTRAELFTRISEQASSAEPLQTVAMTVLTHLVDPAPTQPYNFSRSFRFPPAMLRTVSALPQRPFIVHGEGDLREEVSVSLIAESDEVEVSVALNARTPAQARWRGVEYAHEAVARLSFATSLNTEPTDPAPWRIEGSEPRLGSNGEVIVPIDPTERMPEVCPRPADLGFARQAAPHLPPVGDLPTLASTRPRGVPDARSRLSRTLHWLSLADQLESRSPERLSHAWTAIEHLVAAGTDSKGPEVIRHLAAIGAVELLVATGGEIFREIIAGLYLSACHRPSDSVVIDLLCEVLGATERDRYANWIPGAVVPHEKKEITDRAGFEQLLRWTERLQDIATVIEPEAPFAARRTRDFVDWISKNTKHAKVDPGRFVRWLGTCYREVAALLLHVYDLRNQLVHEADPFVFEGAHRMDDLYRRFRLVVDPLVARLVRRAAAGESDLLHLLAQEAAIYARLEGDLKRCCSDKHTIPFDLERVLAYLSTAEN